MATIYVRDKRDGQVGTMDDSELTPEFEVIDQQTAMSQGAQEPQMQTDQAAPQAGGYTKDQFIQGIQAATAAGDFKVADNYAQIMNALYPSGGSATDEKKKKVDLEKAELELQKAKDPESTEQKKKANLKQEIVNSAQTVVDVIEKGRRGELKGKEYENALKFASSNYAAARGFQEGGKALTGPELTQLAGSIPRLQQQNILEQALGIPPSGKILDSDEELYQKALMAISSSPDSNMSGQAKKKLSSLPENKGFFGGLLQNAGQDAKDIGNSILGLPANLAQSAAQGQPVDIFKLLGMAGEGVISEANQVLGEPFKGGDIIERAGKRAYEKPVTTALDVLPFLKGVKNVRGAKAVQETGAAAKSTGVANENAVQKIGTDMRTNVMNPKVKADPYYARTVDELAQVQKELGLQGNASQQLKQLPAKMDDLNTQMTSAIEGKTVDSQVLTKSVKAQLDKVDYLGDEATFTKEAGKLDARIASAGNNAEKIYSLKSEIAGEMDSVFKKLNRGEDLTPKQAAKLAYWNALKDGLDSVSTDIRRINSLQHKAFQISPGLVGNQGKGGLYLPFLGESFGNTVQSGKDVIGRILQGASL